MSTELNLWSERQRLHFVERLLFWRGYINRRDLVDHFGISKPQATNDLVNYSTRNREGCFYNVRAKRYEASPQMAPILIEPDFSKDMQEVGSIIYPDAQIPFTLSPPIPGRVAAVAHFRELSLAAHRQQSLSIEYWSVKSGTAEWRRISPRTFADDGLRWHVRAFCHKRQRFADFVIGRMSGVKDPEACPFVDRVDHDWVDDVVLLIRPAEELEDNKKKALAMDYNMQDGVFRYRVPKALKLYAARRLGFVKNLNEDPLPMLNEVKELEWFGEE